MIPNVGDRVLVNPSFLRQYRTCKGMGVLMPAHQAHPDATDLLFPSSPQSRDWGDPLTVTRVVANDPDPSKALFWVMRSKPHMTQKGVRAQMHSGLQFGSR